MKTESKILEKVSRERSGIPHAQPLSRSLFLFCPLLFSPAFSLPLVNLSCVLSSLRVPAFYAEHHHYFYHIILVLLLPRFLHSFAPLAPSFHIRIGSLFSLCSRAEEVLGAEQGSAAASKQVSAVLPQEEDAGWRRRRRRRCRKASASPPQIDIDRGHL